MKKVLSECPKMFIGREMYGFAWQEHVAAVPSPMVVVTSYKANGKPNATLQSWFTVANDGEYFCIFGSINKHGHMYSTIKQTKSLVINFPSADIWEKCLATVKNNGYDDDEIQLSGLTCFPAHRVNAPMIAECFLNMECEYAWEKELLPEPGGDMVVLCVKIVSMTMDEAHYNEQSIGRYGKTGYLYNIHAPANPDSEKDEASYIGIIEKLSAQNEPQ